MLRIGWQTHGVGVTLGGLGSSASSRAFTALGGVATLIGLVACSSDTATRDSTDDENSTQTDDRDASRPSANDDDEQTTSTVEPDGTHSSKDGDEQADASSTSVAQTADTTREDATSGSLEPICPTVEDSFVGCGDGVLAEGEACDDGNWISEDGCSRVCVREPLALGGGHTCGLQSDGRLKCWGNSSDGQTGLGVTEDQGDDPGEEIANLPVIELGSDFVPTTVVTGNVNTCAFSIDGSIKCWGSGSYGALGTGDTEMLGDEPGEMGDALPTLDLGSTPANALVLGLQRGCALLENGKVKCWGGNGNGFLGLEDTMPRGWIPNQMGDALPTVDVGDCQRVRSLVVGLEHVCVLLLDGRVKCWGDNEQGQLGLGDIEPRGDETGEMGENLPALDFGTDASVLALAAGSYHTCALFSDETIKCWGANDVGQLGVGDTENRGDEPDEMGEHLTAVQLPQGAHVVDIVANFVYTCVVTSDGQVLCWGSNSIELLGHEGDDVGDEPDEMGDNLIPADLGGAKAIGMLVGNTHGCAIVEGGGTKCWSSNVLGQLGLGYIDL